MKTLTLFITFLIYVVATGYGFASAEDTLPYGVKMLIKQKKTADVEAEALRLSTTGDQFLASLALGELFLLKGELDKADEHFTKAMEMNPAGIEGKVGIAKVLAARGDTAKATKLLQEALKTSPQAVRLYYEMGLLLEASGDLKAAMGAFQQGLERYFAKK